MSESQLLENLETYFLLFFIYSVLGWLAEIIFVHLHDHQPFKNRGFLYGPYCPIYGFGALLMTLYLPKYTDDPITIFLLAVFISGLLEYITSYLMEKLFHARWWDYSKKPFNIEGRVCFENLIYFGLAALFSLYILNPLIFRLIDALGSFKPFLAFPLATIIFTDFILTLLSKKPKPSS